MILQIEKIVELLNMQTVTAIGLLLAFCGLLIWDKVREAKKYTALMTQFNEEQAKNKEILIDLVTKNITTNQNNVRAIEKNNNAIENFKELYKDGK